MEAEQTQKVHFTVKTKMTEESYLYGSMGFRAYSARNGGKKVWIVLLIGLVLTGIGAYISQGMLQKIYIFFFGLFALVFLPLLVMRVTRGLTLRIAYKNILKDCEGNTEQTYTFTDDTMRVEHWYKTVDMKYPFLAFFLEMPEMFMIFTRNSTLYYFKKDELEGGTPEEFRQFIEEKTGIKAEYAYVKG